MKHRVLVVDDDRLVADTLSLIFNGNGYECEARYSAEDGLQRILTFAPALVLCDLTLPGQNGLHLAERVRELRPAIRLLLLTGHPHAGARSLCSSLSLPVPVRLLRKPCRPDDLLRETGAMLFEAQNPAYAG